MLDRRIRRQVERALYNYPQNHKTATEYIEDQYAAGLTSQLDRVGRSTAVSDPTGNKATRLADGSQSALWCRVVEKTLEHFAETGKDTLIRLKYFKGITEWRPLCDKLYIERSALFEWVDDILTYAAMLALQEQLIKVL